MDADYISREEHVEFCKRQDAENNRQNRRIELLEENVREVRDLTASVERLAVNMQNMLKAQEQQSARLEVLESRDGEMWRKVSGYILTAIIGIVLGFVFNQIGL